MDVPMGCTTLANCTSYHHFETLMGCVEIARRVMRTTHAAKLDVLVIVWSIELCIIIS